MAIATIILLAGWGLFRLLDHTTEQAIEYRHHSVESQQADADPILQISTK